MDTVRSVHGANSLMGSLKFFTPTSTNHIIIYTVEDWDGHLIVEGKASRFYETLWSLALRLM